MGGSCNMDKPSRDKKSMDKVVGGSLKMKGMVVKSKKKKKRKHRDDGAESAPEADEEPQHGKGTILSNATSIMGKDTGFMDILQSGDAMLVLHPNTLSYETRTIKAVLSNVSLLLSEPFSTDLITWVDYQFIVNPHVRKEKAETAEEDVKQKKKEKRDELRTFTYQTKTASTWGTLKTVTEKLSHTVTKGDLLNMRCKK